MKWTYSIGEDGELVTLISGNEKELKKWREATELAIKNQAINSHPIEDIDYEELNTKEIK